MDQITEKIIKILSEEIILAEGCTEPIAIAYASAVIKKILGAFPDEITIFLSGNMIKNVKSVVIPNSGCLIGIESAVMLGLVAGDPEAELMVISHVTSEQKQIVKDKLLEHNIKIAKYNGNIPLYIKIEAKYLNDNATIEIKNTHTNITILKRNGIDMPLPACAQGKFNTPFSDRKILSVALIYHLAHTIDITEITPLFQEVINRNTTIADEGLKNTYGINVGAFILENIKKGIYGSDVRNLASSYASAGSDARMSGCELPVMTTSGSGNQGLTASLPIIKYCQEHKLSDEQLIRGLFMSHMTTIHIKTNIGRLSAYCGVICASAGVSAGITFLENGTYEMVCDAITNSLGNLSGVICDGAKASCALKISSSVSSAFDSAFLALNNKVLQPKDGIIGKTIEDTIQNIGNLARQGMKGTDEIILDIMVSEE